MSTDYSNRKLKSYTPEVLDEEPTEVIHEKLRAVVAMCVAHSNIEGDIMSSPAYSALRKGVYSQDLYVRVMSLRGLAALAKHSRDVRKRIATTMDFVRLASEIGATSESLDVLTNADGHEAQEVARYYLQMHSQRELKLDTPSVAFNNRVATFAFDDLVSAVCFHTDAHPKLLQLNYAERAAKMAHSGSFFVRSTAVRAVSGLTRTIEGRQALARTDVFPRLYNLIYNEETRDKLLSTETILFAKYAMQQLLLSESALDIMLPRYEKYFLGMTREAKEDLLMKFDLLDDTDFFKAYDILKQAAVGFGVGTVYGALRSLITTTWVSGMAKPQVKISSLRKIVIGAANSSTGSIPIIALFILASTVEQSGIIRLKDSMPTFLGANIALAGSLIPVIAASLNIFPYGLVPAIIGANAKHILAVVPGTTENEQMVARISKYPNDPNSDVLRPIKPTTEEAPATQPQ